jgi:4-hydroxythreonine-4-phosphate dehydrogenase
MPTKKSKLKIGISCGDINGIGLEVALKALADTRMMDICTPVIYGSVKAATYYKNRIDMKDLVFNITDTAEKLNKRKVNFVNCYKDEVRVDFGESTREAGDLAFRSLKAATEDLAATNIDVLVTAPINKDNIQSKDFDFPGHTEFLANYANEENPLMLLVHENFRVGVVTGHIPLKEVPDKISKELILKKLEIMNKSLIQDFSCTKPKIAVLGLNPHAGDNGLLGDEENKVITPAVEQAMESGIYAFGPFPADGFFGSGMHHKYDGVLAMYHDQGLVPFKTVSFGGGVNFTAGLPIVRTSPDHGTAYDIAGKGVADESSFRAAIYEAIDIHTSRKRYREAASNPLQPQQM